MSIFLPRDELKELTGCKRRAGAIAWLTHNGYKFDIAADGWPRVLRAAVEARLMPSTGKRRMAGQEPDFSAYDPSKKAA